MTIWRGRAREEPVTMFEHLGRRAWRWTLSVRRWAIVIEEEVRFGAGEFGGAVRYAGVWLISPFRVGYHAEYYDGMHRTLQLGWVWLSWGN